MIISLIRYQCTICYFSFTTKANCERHVRTRHRINSSDENCVEIDGNSSGESQLVIDERKEPKITSVIKQTNKTTGCVQFNNELFTIGKSIEPHESYEPSNEETVCKFCKHDFRFNRLLKQHIRIANNRTKNQQANEMKKSFSMFDLNVVNDSSDGRELPANNNDALLNNHQWLTNFLTNQSSMNHSYNLNSHTKSEYHESGAIDLRLKKTNERESHSISTTNEHSNEESGVSNVLINSEETGNALLQLYALIFKAFFNNVSS